MQRFIKTILIFSSTFVFLLALYLLLDPFGVIHSGYSNRMTPYTISDDYVTVEKYLNLKAEGKKHHSFIFGNSKAGAFTLKDLQDFGFSEDIYNMASPGESIYNVKEKIRLIQESGDTIDHVLLVLDDQIFRNIENSHPFFQGPSYIHHPEISTSSYWDFQVRNLMYFYSDLYFVSYIDYRFMGEWKPYMKGQIQQLRATENYIDSNSNQVVKLKPSECEFAVEKAQIVKDEDYHPNQVFNLNSRQLGYLKDICKALGKTKIYVVYGPTTSSYEMKEIIQTVDSILTPTSTLDARAFRIESTLSKDCYWDDAKHYSQYFGQILLDSLDNHE